mmetsp:Transcript_2079/g.2515  ORF Transcript_2079/g.2515 Transcript_2079/m.2515 type:complete len:691 (-) Transcript_2079:155-2227(-)
MLFYKQLLDLATVIGLEVVLYFYTAVVGFYGRYYRELGHRIEFLQTEHKLEKLRIEQDQFNGSNDNQKASTAIEDLISLVSRSYKNLVQLEACHKFSQLGDTISLMKRSLDLLTHTYDLYSLRFDSDGHPSKVCDREMVNQWTGASHIELRRARSKKGLSLAYPPSSSNRSSTDSVLMRRSVRYSTGKARLRVYSDGIANMYETLHKADVGCNFDFDILALGGVSANPLIEIGLALLAPHMQYLCGCDGVLISFLDAVQRQYFENPYHNALHAATVAHIAVALSNVLNIADSVVFDNLDEVSLIVACLGHDIGHPGRNNAFFVNTYDELALVYNDISVLESFHCSVTFRTLYREENNFLSELPPDRYRLMRNNIVEMILATDMKHHFETISRFRVRQSSDEFDVIHESEDLWMLIKMIVKLADLSHAVLKWPQHVKWSTRIAEEFYQQGEDEISRGLVKSPLCDRDCHSASFAKSQKGFIDFVVQPLVSLIAECDKSGAVDAECMKQLEVNRSKWEAMTTSVDIPSNVLAIKCQIAKLHLLAPFIYHPLNSFSCEQQSCAGLRTAVVSEEPGVRVSRALPEAPRILRQQRRVTAIQELTASVRQRLEEIPNIKTLDSSVSSDITTQPTLLEDSGSVFHDCTPTPTVVHSVTQSHQSSSEEDAKTDHSDLPCSNADDEVAGVLPFRLYRVA